MAYTNPGNNENIGLVDHDFNEKTPLLRTSPASDTDSNVDINFFQQDNPRQMYIAITLADIFQKIVFTTIITSFVVLVSSYLGYEHVQLLQIYFTFMSVLWLITAFSNVYIDVWLSKRSIMFGFFIYFIGTALLTAFLSYSDDFRLPKLIVLLPLFFICVGEGICKSFISEFGRCQFVNIQLYYDQLKPFINVLYWIGNICAVFFILFFLGVCELYDFALGIGFCCMCIVFGILSFMLGWSSYRKPNKTDKTGFGLLFKILSNARCKRNSEKISLQNINHWLDYAVRQNGGQFSQKEVDEAKNLFKVLSIFLALIPYWVCNAQGYSTFIFQGFHLNMKINENYIVPVSWTALSNIAAALVFLKVSENIIYPALRKSGYSFPINWRIILGMCFVVLSMSSAGVVQLYAHFDAVDNSIFHQVGKINTTYAPGVNILYTCPQYIFLGVSEVLVGLTVLTLGCKMCPLYFKKLVTSSYYFMIALGHLISLGLLSIGWFPSKKFLDGYDMVIYFFSLAGSSILGILMYIIVISERRGRVNSDNGRGVIA